MTSYYNSTDASAQSRLAEQSGDRATKWARMALSCLFNLTLYDMRPLSAIGFCLWLWITADAATNRSDEHFIVRC